MLDLTILRRISQIIFFSLFFYSFLVLEFPLKHNFIKDIFFALNPLLLFITYPKIFLPSVFVLIITAFLGRVFCSWFCPLGSSFDFLGFLKRDKFFFKTKKLKNIKIFILLSLIILLYIFGIQLFFIFDPIIVLTQSLTFIWIGKLPYILIVFLGLSLIFSSRFYCQNLCPLGALFSIFSKFRILNRKVENCDKCLLCYKKCPAFAIDENIDSYYKRECLTCFKCKDTCPKKGVRFRFKR